MEKSSLETLGQHIKTLRLERGLSLSKLASDAKLAKSSLSLLEQGKGNPTIETIWRLAIQMNVPFGNLIEPLNESLDDQDVQVKLIDQGKERPKVDAYWVSCLPNVTRMAEPHSLGTKESITMISGQLEVGQLDQTVHLNAGDQYDFDADQAHMYRSGSAGASYLVVVTYNF